jgi:exodeoxyribonuclease V alpha subunit
MEQPDKQLSSWIRKGIESGWIGRYEQQLLDFLEDEYGELTDEAEIAVIFLSLFVKAGHICLPLDKTVGDWLNLLNIEETELEEKSTLDRDNLLSLGIFGSPAGQQPFLIDNNRLFVRRNWKQEALVAKKLLELSTKKLPIPDSDKAAGLLQALFDADASGDANWQMVGAALSLQNRLLIISGGPGTGKTTTVARILSILLQVLEGDLRIALAAPTGKAAARMSHALHEGLSAQPLPEQYKSRIPGEARTLHRLLRNYRQNGLLPGVRTKTLPYDLIVIDEASMIDLSMMERLLRHMGDESRLILLGDKDQLSSVEAGAVLGDICIKESNRFSKDIADYLSGLQVPGADEALESNGGDPFTDSIVYLTKSYRFGGESGIATLADAVNRGESERAAELVTGTVYNELSAGEFMYGKQDLEMLFRTISDSLAESLEKDEANLLTHWSDKAWLGVLRKGPFGTDSLNKKIEEYLLAKRLITPEDGWYHGRPVLITRNDYSLGVYNGDLGVCVKSVDGSYHVVFSDTAGTLKRIAPNRIKQYEPAYLLTVHKSQGSEFGHVNLLLPDRETKILTKELIYTAVTRAKNSFRLLGDQGLFKKGIERKTERYTGLRSHLSGFRHRP